MPSKEELEQFEQLSNQIKAATTSLSNATTSPSVLPEKLQNDINKLVESADKRIKAYEWKDKDAKEILQEMRDIKESMDQTAFLVDTVKLAAKAKENQSGFFDSLCKDSLRIAEGVGGLLNDTFVKKDGNLRNPISMVGHGFSNLFTGLKAVVSGCIEAVVGLVKGIRKGYVENDGFLNSAGGMVKEGLAGFIKGGFKGAADGLEKLSDKDKAMKKIEEMRIDNGQEILLLSDKVKKLDDPSCIANKARLEVLKEENIHLAGLQSKLASSQDPKVDSDLLRSVRLLSVASAGASVLHTGLEMIHDFSKSQKFGGLEGGKALEKLSTDVFSATKNYNAVLDNPSIGKLDKVGVTLKAFGMAVFKGLEGLYSGFKEGLKQEGMGSSIKGALFSGFAGAAEGAKKSIETDTVKLTAPSSTQTVPVTNYKSADVALNPLQREEEQQESDIELVSTSGRLTT